MQNPGRPKDNGLTVKDYESAIAAQYAVNLSGVLGEFAVMRDRIWADVRASGGGTDRFNHHPVVIMFVNSMQSLAGLEGGQAFKEFDRADTYCENKVRELGGRIPFESYRNEESSLKNRGIGSTPDVKAGA